MVVGGDRERESEFNTPLSQISADLWMDLCLSFLLFMDKAFKFYELMVKKRKKNLEPNLYTFFFVTSI